MQDSNLRMHESKSCALPTWLIPIIKLVSAQGFEPRTHALEGRCSIQLSYAPIYWSGKRDSNSRLQPWQGCALPLNYSRIYFNGGTNRARTCDPLLVRQVLSQLSYGPILERVKGIEPSQLAWKARTLPLSYTRKILVTHRGIEPLLPP